MGNKIGTLLTKSKLKKHRKEMEVVTSKVTYSEVNEELEEAYLTPKSHESQLTDEEQLILEKGGLQMLKLMMGLHRLFVKSVSNRGLFMTHSM